MIGSFHLLHLGEIGWQNAQFRIYAVHWDAQRFADRVFSITAQVAALRKVRLLVGGLWGPRSSEHLSGSRAREVRLLARGPLGTPRLRALPGLWWGSDAYCSRRGGALPREF